MDTWYTLSKDGRVVTISENRRVLTITRRTPEGPAVTTTFTRNKHTAPFADADIEYVLNNMPVVSKNALPGQRYHANRHTTRFGTLYTHLMTGPPTWWLPRATREKDGTIMSGWLRLGIAIKFDRHKTSKSVS